MSASIIRYLPFYIFSLLPLPVLYVISDFIFLILYYLIGYRKAVVTGNLTRAFPEADQATISRIRKDFYHHFCDMWVEAVKSLTMPRNIMVRRFRVVNPELVQRMAEKRLSIIAFTGHLGNWEWMTSLAITMPYRMVAFYQPQSSTYFDGLIKLIRERYGLTAVESSRGYRALKDFATRGIPTMTLVLGDQRPSGHSGRQWLTFFGQRTAFMTGADRMAVRLGQAIVFPAIRKTGRGWYELEFIPIREDGSSTDPAGILEEYAKLLERSIRENPACWLWSHKRWKPLPDDNLPDDPVLIRHHG